MELQIAREIMKRAASFGIDLRRLWHHLRALWHSKLKPFGAAFGTFLPALAPHS